MQGGLLDAMSNYSAARMPPNAPGAGGPADFAAAYGPIAARIGSQLGVEPTVILGQLGLETGWGKSIIPGTNNLGNIKDFAGSGVSALDNMTGSRDKYRSYASPDAFAADYVDLIKRKYPTAIGAKDPQAFAMALKSGGYAEDPRYVDKVAQASRMAGATPGPVANAIGRAVSSLVPSANAQQANKGPSMAQAQGAEASSPEWDALNARFAPQARTAEESSDPWEQLNARFVQPASQKALAGQAVQVAQARGDASAMPATAQDSGIGGFMRRAINATPAGFLANALHAGGTDKALALGVASGAADLGDALMRAGTRLAPTIEDPRVDFLTQGIPKRADVERMNAARQGLQQDFNKDNSGVAFNVGRLAGNVAITAPVGGVIGAGSKGAASLPLLSRAAPALNAIGNAAASGGMVTGFTPATIGQGAANMGARMIGGGLTGYASAGLVDPSSANLGGVIGASLPPVVAGVGKLGSLGASVVRSFRTPEEARAAQAILDAGGFKTPEEIAAVRQALAQQGPSILPEGATVPQILQNPGISQLQRTLRNSGDTALLEREAAQEAGRKATLNRVSPISGTVQQSADNFGNALTAAVRPAERQASKEVRAAFDAVDPFNETRMQLPLAEMHAARDKFLGPGTFSAGSKADAAIAEAERIGSEALPSVAAAKAPTARKQGEDLFAAIRSMGGIRQDSPGAAALAGEVRDLKQSGARSIIQNGRGQSPDTLAQAMHAKGFIPDDDPATLLNAIREHAAGNKVFSTASERGGAMRAGLEASMGEAPGNQVLPKLVPFQQVQNLRSSLGEAAEQASARGGTREAAALRQMVADLDARANAVMSGQGKAGEYFPDDVVKAWEKAIALHADKMDRFHVGPQAAIFRKGGDGLPAAEGGELAPKFFSSRGSQSADIAAFHKIADLETLAALKNFAIMDAASQTDRLGNLSNSQYGNWLNGRTGAINGLFGDGERAALYGVGKDLQRADSAASLGMARGSNTVQNAQAALSLGALDHPAVDFLANRTPIIRQFTGPMLSALRESAKRGKVERLGGLLSDPESLDRAIAQVLSQPVRQSGLLEAEGLIPLLLRGAPAATPGSGRQ